MTVDRGDGEFRGLLQPGEGLVGVEAEEVFEARGDLVQHPDVGAGGEELLAVAPDHDDVGLPRPSRASRMAWSSWRIIS
jgi:hypothetical protein